MANIEKLRNRTYRLIKDGAPRYIKCFDNGDKSFDRYTVIYTGHYKGRSLGITECVGMSERPFHPQGFGQHFELQNTTSYKHLGKRIKFTQLPPDCQKLAWQDYKENWDLYDLIKKHSDQFQEFTITPLTPQGKELVKSFKGVYMVTTLVPDASIELWLKEADKQSCKILHVVSKP